MMKVEDILENNEPNFKIFKAHNKTQKQYGGIRNSFEEKVREFAKAGQVNALMYFSGHAVVFDKDKNKCTHIKRGGEYIDIQSDAIRLAKLNNVNVFLMLDCCREKSDKEIEKETESID